MERIEYTNMSELEDNFWWYCGLHSTIKERIRALRLNENSSILDAGCGTGGLLKFLMSEPNFKPYRFYGIEWDKEAAQIASEKTGLAITCGSVNAMPFPNVSFDVILSQDVLYHKNVDEKAAMSEFYRCLRPNGHLLLSLPAYKWMSSAHDIHVHGIRRYTVGSCKKLLESNGFVVKNAGYWNSLLFPIMAVQRLTIGKLRRQSDVQKIPEWQNSFFKKVLNFELQRSIHLPFGGSVWCAGIKL